MRSSLRYRVKIGEEILAKSFPDYAAAQAFACGLLTETGKLATVWSQRGGGRLAWAGSALLVGLDRDAQRPLFPAGAPIRDRHSGLAASRSCSPVHAGA